MSVDKIQSIIEAELDKAVASERKRVIGLVKEAVASLLAAVKDGDGTPEVAPRAARRGRLAEVEEPADDAVEDIVEEADGAPNTIATGDDKVPYDISEVDDEEVDESEYKSMKVGELREICKERGLPVPNGWKKPQLIKLLILDDEENED